jgi:hypothetical protein
MRRARAAAGTAAFLVLVPGTVAGLVRWWLTGWRSGAAYPLPDCSDSRHIYRLTARSVTGGGMGGTSERRRPSRLTADYFCQPTVSGRGVPKMVAPTLASPVGTA